MSEIIPAILPKDAEDLAAKVAALPLEIPFIHLDVLEEDIWTEINKDFEAHLMVASPDKIVERWVKRGAKRIIIHKLEKEIGKFRGQVEIGLGVELDVPLEEVFSLIPKIDFIHLMSIDAIGTQGDDFEPRIFDRIKLVKEKFPQMAISIDGGINTNNYQALQDAGADRLIVGSGFEDLWKLLTKK